jgi:hypothetical protein
VLLRRKDWHTCLSALCRLYVMSTWSTRPSLRTLSPWTPGKEAAGTVEPSELGRAGAPCIMISSPSKTRHIFNTLHGCTCHCAEMTRRIDAELTAVNDKKKLTRSHRTGKEKTELIARWTRVIRRGFWEV